MGLEQFLDFRHDNQELKTSQVISTLTDNTLAPTRVDEDRLRTWKWKEGVTLRPLGLPRRMKIAFQFQNPITDLKFSRSGLENSETIFQQPTSYLGYHEGRASSCPERSFN